MICNTFYCEVRKTKVFFNISWISSLIPKISTISMQFTFNLDHDNNIFNKFLGYTIYPF